MKFLILKLVKNVVIGGIIGISISFITVEFLRYKLTAETNDFEKKSIEIKQLTDTYYLCLGLYHIYQDKHTKKECEDIRQSIHTKIKLVDKSYSYNKFVSEHLK